MWKIVNGEPPPGALGSVVWPSDITPNYQITDPAEYRADRPRRPGLPLVELEATVELAKMCLKDTPDLYSIWVVVE